MGGCSARTTASRSLTAVPTTCGNGSASYLPWVASQQISTHWLRHTTLTWVERNFGFAVARAYAGHADADNKATNTTYVQAELHEVVLALAALTGEPHPLAP